MKFAWNAIKMFLQSLTHVGEAEIILDDAAAAAATAIAPLLLANSPEARIFIYKVEF